jgi:polyhydroxybutyrate depolymerase
MNQDSHTSFIRVAPAFAVGLCLAYVTLPGCNVEDPSGAEPSAGSATGGSPGTAGTLSSGGSGMGTAGTAQGGASLAGAATAAGQAGTGTAGGAGGAVTTAGSGAGGVSGGGGAGVVGAAGSGIGGSSTGAAEPSAGCGKASPMTGSSGSPLTVSSHQYYVKLPTAYDASKPYRLLFVFNPTGNPITWAEQSAGFESLGAKDTAIRVYPAPASMASGWGASDVAFFSPLYEKVTGDYCVDKARVFAAGESSGGDFSSILGCEHADKLRGVAPGATKNVSQYPLTAASRKCTGQVTPIVIHGKNDNVVGPENGPKTRDFYAALNHCGAMTTPVQGYTDTLSNCVQYQGCDAGFPVYWCLHTDPNYSNTNHGWPAFAAKMVWSVFSAY